MKDFVNVFMFYLLKKIKSVGFLIVTLVMCIGAVIALLVMNNFFNNSKKEILYIVNQSEQLNNIFENEVYKNDIGDIVLNFSMIDNESSEDELINKAKEDNISIAVFKDTDEDTAMNIIGKEKFKYTDIALFQNITNQIYQANNAEKLGIPSETLKLLNTTITIKETNVSMKQGKIIVPFVLFLIMIVFIILYSNSAVNDIAYLKTNRVMEIFSTSIKPLPLYLGVNIAAVLIPVIQVMLTGVCTYLTSIAMNIDFTKIENSVGINFDSLDIDKLIMYVIFLVLGYFIYSLISTSIVSIVSKVEDINSIAVPIAMIGLIQYFIGILALEQDSLILKVFSYFPLTSPSIMFLRYAVGYAEVSEAFISISILILIVCILAYLGANLFTKGVSYYGNVKDFLSSISNRNGGVRNGD